MEERTEQSIQVRQVTELRAAWTEEERGRPGAFTFQLILDSGVEEYVLRPSSEDAEVLLELFARSDRATFDKARKVLVFGSVSTALNP